MVYTATQPTDAGQPGQTQFELPLNELPLGAYTAKVAIADTDLSEAFELTGNPPPTESGDDVQCLRARYLC